MKNIQNEFTVRFPSKSTNEAFARSIAASFAAQLDPTIDELFDLKTAVSEAVTNSIVHGYSDTVGIITMTVRLIEPCTVEVIIRDKGCGIPDIEKARTPMFTTGGNDRTGMGFTIMESFTDGISVRSAAGKGTTVKLKKRLSPRPSK